MVIQAEELNVNTSVIMNKLNLGTEMKGFPSGIDWSLVLHRVAVEEECDLRFSKEEYISTFAHTQYVFDFKTESESKVLLFESFNGRKNFVEYINALSELISSDVVVEKPGKRSVDLFRGLKYKFCFFPSWQKILKKARLGGNFERRALYYLVNLHRFYLELEKSKEVQQISFKKYNLFVTFYDSMPKDAFFVQLMRLNGVKTATLQHGAFTAQRNNQLVNSGVELRTLNSDYFLCWNRFTVDEAIKEGFDKRRCIISGILGFAKNDKRILCDSVTNNTFGVVIGHPTFEEENKILIESANKLASKTGMSFYLKLHPNYSETYFDDVVDKKYYRGIIKKGIPMLDYANTVEFSIVGASTVFVELVYLGHPVLRYSSGEIVDKWRDIKVGYCFDSPDGVTVVYEKMKNATEEKELFDYLCSVENVRDSYKDILNQLSA